MKEIYWLKYNGKPCQLTRIDNQTYQVEIFRDKYGDLSTLDKTGCETLMLGFRQSTLEGKIATVSGHLDRLYQDESCWTTEPGDSENVDVETSFTVESYSFLADGYAFGFAEGTKNMKNDGEKGTITHLMDQLDRLPSISYIMEPLFLLP